MKFKLLCIFIISGLISSSALFADGVITNGAQVKVKNGTHWKSIGSVVVETNASFIIEGMVTVNQSIINNSGFQAIQIRSTTDFTGSLIFESGFPQATVERYITDMGSHIIGSPVSGESASVLDFGNDPATSLYSYSDGNPLAEIVDGNEELINGVGYYYSLSDGTEEGVVPVFEGELNSSDLFLNANTSPALEFNTVGRNLIANPYSSSIDWDNDQIEWSDLELSIWIFDSEEHRFKFRCRSGYGNLENGVIPMGQAFFVRAKSAEAQLTIPASARLHNDQQLYKKNEGLKSDLNFVVLNFQQNSLSDEVWIGYDPASTDAFDDGIDISKMFSFEDRTEVYCMQNNLEMSVNMVENPAGDTKIIPVYFKAGSSDICTVTVNQMQGLEDYDVLLEDLMTGDVVNVSEMDNYEFNAEIGAAHDRFLLHLNPVGNGVDDHINSNDVKIYSNQHHIYIKNQGKYALQPKTVFIYDINGSIIKEVSLGRNELDVLLDNFNRKFIIVKVLYDDAVFSQKLINL